MRGKLSFAVLAFILFIIPFFWFKPGEIDFGGDSSRLYYYDPFHYLSNVSLWNISPSSQGVENISSYTLPYIAMLTVLKHIIKSPYLLVSASNGASLVVAFLSVYFILRELLGNKYKQEIKEVVAIVSGLLYVLSPSIIQSFNKVILTYNQFFLNPLMFLLLLYFLVRKKIIYVFTALIISFIFSPNFSYGASPPFFAFYPVSILFLLIYVNKIRNIFIPVKQLFYGCVLFIALQSFHLIPQVISLFSSGSAISSAVFSTEAKFNRGLSYFMAIAPQIKVSVGLMNLPQMSALSFNSFFSIIFPLIIVFGFLWNKGKTLLLTGIFFLITLFWETANITFSGYTIYKLLFNIPGFSMFRNFYGQWAYVYLFFYVLLFGQSLCIVLSKLQKKFVTILLSGLIILVISSAYPFINGTQINAKLWQSKEVNIAMQMDPQYEDVLAYIRTLPVDGKILTLPLSDPGYQILAGLHGGAYQGPSTVSYLTGKKDFAGYEEFGIYKDVFLDAIKKRDYNQIFGIFGILNIKYIFYNSDPYIYEVGFPSFPYDHVRKYFPKNQLGYHQLLTDLSLIKIKDFGNKYHVYSVPDYSYFPHVYPARTVVASNNLITAFNLQDVADLYQPVFVDLNSKLDTYSAIMIEAQNLNPIEALRNNYHLHRHDPFLTRKLDDPLYIFALIQEEFELWKRKKNVESYLDFSLFYASKRIAELAKWGNEIPITMKSWQPALVKDINWKMSFNSWEASLMRYAQSITVLLEWIHNSTQSETWKHVALIKLNEQLWQHRARLHSTIQSLNISKKERTYLLPLVNRAFDELLLKIVVPFTDLKTISYKVKIPKEQFGEYEIYLHNSRGITKDIARSSIRIDGEDKYITQAYESAGLVRYDNAILKAEDTAILLRVVPTNLIENEIWQGTGGISISKSSEVLTISNVLGEATGGLTRKIFQIQPNTQYVISFDYLTSGEDFIFRLFDKKELSDGVLSAQNIYIDRILNSREWKTQQFIWTSDATSLEAYVQIVNTNMIRSSPINLRNFSVFFVPNYEILLKKVMTTESSLLNIPNIQSTKINPTKYRIAVKQATHPYTLVFSDSFNAAWKVYISDVPSKAKSDSSGNSIGNIFETIGLKKISEQKHLMANGYANAWYIEPGDVQWLQDYELIIEYDSQKYFYIGASISIITFIGLLSYGVLRYIKKRSSE